MENTFFPGNSSKLVGLPGHVLYHAMKGVVCFHVFFSFFCVESAGFGSVLARLTNWKNRERRSRKHGNVLDSKDSSFLPWESRSIYSQVLLDLSDGVCVGFQDSCL